MKQVAKDRGVSKRYLFRRCCKILPWSTCIENQKKIVQLGHTPSWTFFIYFVTERNEIIDTKVFLGGIQNGKFITETY